MALWFRLVRDHAGAFGIEKTFILRGTPTKAEQNCVIKYINKVEDVYIITAIGKYEISYSMLSDSFKNVGEKIKRGEIIGKLRKVKDNILDSPYLMLMIKDSKGHYVEHFDVFK